MQFDEMSHDGEAESEAAMLSSRRTISLTKTFEYVRKEGGRNARTAVCDIDAHMLPEVGEIDANVAALWCELDGIREQIPQDLLESRGIPARHHRFGGQSQADGDPLGLRCGPYGVDARADDRREIDRPHVKKQPPGNNAGDIQQIGDEPCLYLGIPLDRLECPPAVLFADGVVQQHAGPSDDRIQRGPQFV